jgi:hypothetical protein
MRTDFSSSCEEFSAPRSPANSARLNLDAFLHCQLFELRQQNVFRNARTEASTSTTRLESTPPTPVPTSTAPPTLAAISISSTLSPEPEPPSSTVLQLDTNAYRLDFERGAATELEAAEIFDTIPPNASDKRIGSGDSGRSKGKAKVRVSQ